MSRAGRCIKFIEPYCRAPKGERHGRTMRLGQFQKDWLEEALADGVEAAILPTPRGNGKSTFGGAAAQQTAKFDQVFQKGIAKGDGFFAAAGDNGTFDLGKQHHKTAVGPNPGTWWPATSPYVTAVGGTQLQFGWTWDPLGDVLPRRGAGAGRP